MPVRAKFRCLSITTKHDGTIVATLAPVKREGKDSENNEFWKYSPNGECELFYFRECPIVVGAYYYVDMEHKLTDQQAPDLWTLCRRDENPGHVNVELSWHLMRSDYRAPPPVGLLSGRFKVGLSEDAAGAREAFKPINSRWSMAFVFAEPSDS